MAGLPRRRLWKRRYSSFLHGDQPRPDPADAEERLTLFLSGHMLDLAQKLVTRHGETSVQHYCEDLLVRSLENERSRFQIEAAEARHGTMEGLRAIADDPEYLGEWATSILHRDKHDHEEPPITVDIVSPFALSVAPVVSLPAPQAWSQAASKVVKAAGLTGSPSEIDEFLPTLRRGEIPRSSTIEELGAALVEIHRELAGRSDLDRHLAFAIHRLAFESQVLHTDAWPDAFDNATIDAIRAIQAAADRILSGHSDIY